MRGPSSPDSPGFSREARAATRIVHHGEALAWLAANAPLVDASVVTSLPDVSEVPALGFAAWRSWFQQAATATMAAVSDAGVAIFFQSDIRHDGVWVDKGALVQRASEQAQMQLVFHKIVCRKPPGTPSFGRATYSHLLAFSRSPRPTPRRATADVLPEPGYVPGRKAMGAAACLVACRYVLEETVTRTIVDPFCGWGTALAVANALGMQAVGVDLSARMCRRARALALTVEGEPP
jgi:hypothetical protein